MYRYESTTWSDWARRLFALAMFFVAGLFGSFTAPMFTDGVVAEISSNVYRDLYAPILRRVDRDTWYGDAWDRYEKYWCKKAAAETCHVSG